MTSDIECIVLIVSSSKISPRKLFMQPPCPSWGFMTFSWPQIYGQMSPQSRTSVPAPPCESSLLHGSHVLPQVTLPSITLSSDPQRWQLGLLHTFSEVSEEEGDFHWAMPGAARESSRRSESTYLQRAHNEGPRIKQQALIRALEGRRKELGGSRPLLRKPIDCHWGKSFKDLSRELGLPKCQGGGEIHYRDLNSLHIQELQNRHKHPLQLSLCDRKLLSKSKYFNRSSQGLLSAWEMSALFGADCFPRGSGHKSQLRA